MRRQGWWDVLTAVTSAMLREPDAAIAERDPLSLVVHVASLPTDEAKVAEIIGFEGAMGLYVTEDLDFSGLVPVASEAPELDDHVLPRLWVLADKAASAADARAFGRMPNVQRREFVDALEEVLEAVGMDALPWVTHALYLLRPHSYLSLDGAVRAFITSPDGLDIDEGDLPTTAMDYLDLLMFLTGQMGDAGLPYGDFLQMGRAIQQGRRLRDGLVPEDRRALVERLRPSFARLYPRDDDRVEAELARLVREG